MRFTFLGCGDAFGTGGRFNTCFHVESPSLTFLIDCGASSLIAMRKFGVDPNSVRTIFLTHLHGDHFGGLPFLLLDAQFCSRRTGPLTIAGPPGTRERLTQAMEVFYPGSSRAKRRFETEVIELAPEGAQAVGPATVAPFPADHSAGAPCFALRIAVDGKTVAYSGDTAWTEALLPAGRDADLFVIESYFFEKGAAQHIDYRTLRAQLPRIGAKRVILTHFGPEMLARAGEIDVEAAADGKSVDL